MNPDEFQWDPMEISGIVVDFNEFEDARVPPWGVGVSRHRQHAPESSACPGIVGVPRHRRRKMK